MTNREIGDPIAVLAQTIEKHEHDIQNIYGKLMRAFVGSRIVAGNVTGVLPPGTVITPTIINMLNTSGGALVDGDVVILDLAAPRSVKTTTVRGDSLVIGVVRDVNNIGSFSNGSETPIQLDGYLAELHVTGSVAVGDYLRTSATVKLAESVGAAPTSNVFARALSVAAAGSVNAYILAAGPGGSGGTGGGGMGPPGDDGAAGDDGPPGPPGPAGAAGAPGAAGAVGQPGAILMWEPDAPDEPLMIPGPPGQAGATGAIGPAGPDGAGLPPIVFIPDDPDTGGDSIMFPPGNASRRYVSFYPIIPNTGVGESVLTFNVNDATGRVLGGIAIPVPFDVCAYSHFRLYFFGNSNAVGQTVTVRMVKSSSYASPVSAAGDLVVTNTGAFWDSGIVAITAVPIVKEDWSVGVKGSNSTVDIELSAMTLVLMKL